MNRINYKRINNSKLKITLMFKHRNAQIYRMHILKLYVKYIEHHFEIHGQGHGPCRSRDEFSHWLSIFSRYITF